MELHWHVLPLLFLTCRKQNKNVSEMVLSEVGATLRSYPFNFQGARILSGGEEGAYGWITVNYLLGNFKEVISERWWCGTTKPGHALSPLFTAYTPYHFWVFQFHLNVQEVVRNGNGIHVDRFLWASHESPFQQKQPEFFRHYKKPSHGLWHNHLWVRALLPQAVVHKSLCHNEVPLKLFLLQLGMCKFIIS